MLGPGTITKHKSKNLVHRSVSCCCSCSFPLIIIQGCPRYIPFSYAKIWGKTKFQLREYPRSGSKTMSVERNTPGTAGGPGGRDRTLAVKSRKNVRKITFYS